MNRNVKIGKRIIGDGYPCFIIAEAGSNHNGDLKKAFELIDVAVEAKADAVKFQTFKAEKIYAKNAGNADYLKTGKSIFDIIKEMEMPTGWIPQLAAYCRTKGIIFFSTPFDEESADLLEKYMPLFKIASYEMTDVPLVKYIAQKKKPIIMSTGTANLSEVQEAVDVIQSTGNKNLILMQCTACYPTPVEFINARSIVTLKNEFKIPVGLSDHSREFDVAPMAAVALGANCIEKHFTLSNVLPGPDHKFAVEPLELKLMVQKIRDVEAVLGSGEKSLLSVERELQKFARRSVFAIKEISVGEPISRQNTAILRNGKLTGGIAPKEYEKILGRRAKRKISSDHPITKGDLGR